MIMTTPHPNCACVRLFYIVDLSFVVRLSSAKTAKIGSLENFRLCGIILLCYYGATCKAALFVSLVWLRLVFLAWQWYLTLTPHGVLLTSVCPMKALVCVPLLETRKLLLVSEEIFVTPKWSHMHHRSITLVGCHSVCSRS